MQNQCICLTCNKQHEKVISRGTGPNRVHNQKQHHKRTRATKFLLPPPPSLPHSLQGRALLNTRSVGKRIKKITYWSLKAPLGNSPDWWRLCTISRKHTCIHTANANVHYDAGYIIQRLKYSVVKSAVDNLWLNSVYFDSSCLKSYQVLFSKYSKNK